MISNERPFEWSIMWQYLNKNYIFSSGHRGHNKVSYLTSYFIFLTFWSRSVLLKIDQQTKSNLMIYDLTMHKKWISEVPSFRFFLIKELKKMSNISFLSDFSDHGLLVKNGQQWKNFQMIYNITMIYNILLCLEKKNFPTDQSRRHNFFYLTCISLSLHFGAIVFY